MNRLLMHAFTLWMIGLIGLMLINLALTRRFSPRVPQDGGLIHRRLAGRRIYQRSAAVVAMPVRWMMTVGSMTIGPMTPARTCAYCQPTFRGEPRKVGFHAGRRSCYVGNDISTEAHRIRGACLPFRIGALGARTVRAASKSSGKQCKRAN